MNSVIIFGRDWKGKSVIKNETESNISLCCLDSFKKKPRHMSDPPKLQYIWFNNIC